MGLTKTPGHAILDNKGKTYAEFPMSEVGDSAESKAAAIAHTTAILHTLSGFWELRSKNERGPRCEGPSVPSGGCTFERSYVDRLLDLWRDRKRRRKGE